MVAGVPKIKLLIAFAGMILFMNHWLVAQTVEALNANAQINRVLEESDKHFRTGLQGIRNNQRAESAIYFDRSVESFLLSSLNIQRDPKLQNCYSELIETVYRIEFPFKTVLPDFQGLTEKCGWRWNAQDHAIADAVTKITKDIGDRRSSLNELEAQRFIQLEQVAQTKADKAFVTLQQRKDVLRDLHTRKAAGENLESQITAAKDMWKKAANEYLDARQALDRARVETVDGASIGLQRQVFEPAPLDGLSKLELTKEELNVGSSLGSVSGERNYSQPSNRVASSTYSRPSSLAIGSSANNVKVVKALAGDTVLTLAVRHGADPTEVAKYNGLLSTSVLGAGREIKLPSRGGRIEPVEVRVISPSPPTESKLAPQVSIGTKPTLLKNGSVKVVVDYFNENLHDPYSMRIVRWSPIIQSSASGLPCWQVSVRYRAKNLMGAYKLSDRSFCIRNNKIVSTFSLD